MRATLLGRTTDLLADGLSSSEEDEMPLDKEVKEEDQDVREEAEDGPDQGQIADRRSAHDGVQRDDTAVRCEKKVQRWGRGGRRGHGGQEGGARLGRWAGAGGRACGFVGRGDSSGLKRDFSLSSVCLLGWLSQLMVKGPRAGSRWMLEAADLKARCRAFLQALCDTF